MADEVRNPCKADPKEEQTTPQERQEQRPRRYKKYINRRNDTGDDLRNMSFSRIQRRTPHAMFTKRSPEVLIIVEYS